MYQYLVLREVDFPAGQRHVVRQDDELVARASSVALVVPVRHGLLLVVNVLVLGKFCLLDPPFNNMAKFQLCKSLRCTISPRPGSSCARRRSRGTATSAGRCAAPCPATATGSGASSRSRAPSGGGRGRRRRAGPPRRRRRRRRGQTRRRSSWSRRPKCRRTQPGWSPCCR